MNLLLIPTSMDALLVPSEIAVRQPAADFSALPYRTNGVTYNPANAYLSQSIVAQPFNDENLWLQPGVHLSWSLPQAFLRAATNGSGAAVFPSLPNRWLIVRTDTDSTTEAWIIESDYVWPEGQGSAQTNITIPWTPNLSLGESQSFRYAGRTVPIADWQEDATAERITPLTAPGYGIEDFLTLYSNCFSLFGLYDNTVADLATGLNGSVYQLLGWYNNLAVDPVALWGATANTQNLASGLQQAFGWTLTADSPNDAPQGALIYSSLALNTSQGLQMATPDLSTLDLWVGNTATEALAALLANQIDSVNAATIEEQLDAVQLHATGTATSLEDLTFPSRLHRQGFVKSGGGKLWELVAPDAQTITPPLNLVKALAHVNNLQEKYNRATAQILSWRQRTFQDWYKYMVSKFPPDLIPQNYPDPDLVAYFIEHQDMRPLHKLSENTGELHVVLDESNGSLTTVTATPSSAITLAATLAAALTSLAEESNGASWTLRLTAAPPCLAPAEPVLLISGTATQPSGSQLATPLTNIPCQIASIASAAPTQGSAATTFLGDVTAVADQMILMASSYQWSQQPWLPVSMEWQAQVLPLTDNGNDPVAAGGFSQQYITGNFTLGSGPDLTLNTGAKLEQQDGAVYAGRCTLSAHGPSTLAFNLTVYLTQNLLPTYFVAQDIPASQQGTFDLVANLPAVTSWFQQTYNIASLTTAEQAANLEYSTLRALAALTSADIPPSLSQRFSGFNAGLLMCQQTLQLAVTDPMSLAIGEAFTAKVANHVRGGNRRTPMPQNIFLPLRAGALEITQLRLVDRFGQIAQIAAPTCQPAMTLRNTALPSAIYMAPRLTQSSRLNAQWLGSRHDALESGDSPSDSPICGWVVPNYLDNSLSLYETDGSVAGQITQDPAQVWQASPAHPQKTSVRSVHNLHLQKLARTIIAAQTASQNATTTYLEALLNTLEQCAPLNVFTASGQTSSLPLMIGRPLAVVRLSLQWILDGLPAIDESWNAFRLDLARTTRDQWRVNKVTLPVALGDAEQAANGIIGYWIDAPQGYANNDTLYAPLYPLSAAAPGSSSIQVPTSMSAIVLDTSLASGPVTLTALIDPRAPVYIRSGIAPEASLQLSPSIFAAAMRSLAVTFYTGPIITPQSQLRITLPACPGGKWKWYSPSNGLYTAEEHTPFNPQATYPGQRIIREGWAQLKLPTDDVSAAPLTSNSGWKRCY